MLLWCFKNNDSYRLEVVVDENDYHVLMPTNPHPPIHIVEACC